MRTCRFDQDPLIGPLQVIHGDKAVEKHKPRADAWQVVTQKLDAVLKANKKL